jgi:predicted dehydrogenase
MPSDTPLRTAIVGTGLIAMVGHLPAIRELSDDVELVAAVDISKPQLEAFADEAGVAARYTDLAAMLKQEAPDLVIVATPPVVHREQVTQALEAGAWVWCEKPPALSLAEYDDMCAAEQNGGPYAASVFQLRFGPAARHYRSLLREGRLGRPLVTMCQTTWFRDDAYFEPEWRGNFRGDGGPSMALGIHQIDLMLTLLGPWREVSAFAATTSRPITTDDVSTTIVRFESGALGTIVTSAVSPHSVSRLRVDTELATIELTHLYRYTNSDWVCTPAEGVAAEVTESWANNHPEESSGHGSQLRDLIANVRAGKRPETSGQGGRSTLELIAALYKSAFTGRAVERDEIDASDPFYYGLDSNAH